MSREVLARQQWMIAGASAGFLDGQRELAGPHAAKVALTGSIRSVIHLLDTTDMLVRLPARLTLMTGAIDPEQMIEVDGQSSPRRDFALWSRTEMNERPGTIQVRKLISEFLTRLDGDAPTFGLEL